ncbi:MAG: hypothetical protein QF721_06530 [Verrucomicrobiota bacterium]|nr:hypothetical protein [Verrucomicrobiota bacterium]MDP7049088.1 hypothetical protein [Verrucomicrobiota bacterium]
MVEVASLVGVVDVVVVDVVEVDVVDVEVAGVVAGVVADNLHQIFVKNSKFRFENEND